MAFRFFRRKRIAPGVSLNLSKRGGSLSFGPRGAKVTVGTRGVRGTVGAPGTGMHYTKHVSLGSGRRAKARTPEDGADSSSEAVNRQLSLGFLRWLFTPKKERAFVQGLKALSQKNHEEAEGHLNACSEFTDAAFLLGILAVKREAVQDGAAWLTRAYQDRDNLQRLFNKYGLVPSFPLSITSEVATFIEPDTRGTLLLLSQAFHEIGRHADALKCAHTLHKTDPDDITIRLAAAELLAKGPNPTSQTWQDIVKLSEGAENESEVHAALLFCRARALFELGLFEGARDTLTTVLRRSKDRPDALLRRARYLRAQVYEALGRKSQARKEFEQIYAEAPDYEDVAERLGLG